MDPVGFSAQPTGVYQHHQYYLRLLTTNPFMMMMMTTCMLIWFTTPSQVLCMEQQHGDWRLTWTAWVLLLGVVIGWLQRFGYEHEG